MIHYFQLFISAVLLTSCKAFQQENVIHRKWRLIPPTSYIFAMAELNLLAGGVSVVLGDESILIGALFMGTGAWIGCFVSMWTHDRMAG